MEKLESQHLIWALENIVGAAKNKADLLYASEVENKELKLKQLIDILDDAAKKSAKIQCTTVDGIAVGTCFYISTIEKI